MAGKKKPAAKAPVKSATKRKAPVDGDAKLLGRYQHHRDAADKHRAHADLIEARLRTQGKEIRHQYPGDSIPAPRSSPIPRIVNVKK